MNHVSLTVLSVALILSPCCIVGSEEPIAKSPLDRLVFKQKVISSLCMADDYPQDACSKIKDVSQEFIQLYLLREKQQKVALETALTVLAPDKLDVLNNFCSNETELTKKMRDHTRISSGLVFNFALNLLPPEPEEVKRVIGDAVFSDAYLNDVRNTKKDLLGKIIALLADQGLAEESSDLKKEQVKDEKFYDSHKEEIKSFVVELTSNGIIEKCSSNREQQPMCSLQ